MELNNGYLTLIEKLVYTDAQVVQFKIVQSIYRFCWGQFYRTHMLSRNDVKKIEWTVRYDKI